MLFSPSSFLENGIFEEMFHLFSFMYRELSESLQFCQTEVGVVCVYVEKKTLMSFYFIKESFTQFFVGFFVFCFCISFHLYYSLVFSCN